MHSRKAIAQAYRDAAEALESNADFTELTCCGNPLTELGHCQFRSHPTPGNVGIFSYPEYYDEDGHLIE